MAKTKYGQRMYRARQATAQERADEGATEYTVDAKNGRAIVVEPQDLINYYVTDVTAGQPARNAVRMNPSQIESRYGVDIMKGKLINGVTTEGYTQALILLRQANQPAVTQRVVSDYLTGEDKFTDVLGGMSSSARSQINYAATADYSLSEGAKVLRDIVDQWDKLHG